MDSNQIHFEQITTPTLLLDEQKARANIGRMAQKAAANHVNLRPHFKTHQSGHIGAWFQEYGAAGITASSVTMAAYFAQFGWDDITIAFPVNPRQFDIINKLAGEIRLNLLVETAVTPVSLAQTLTHPVHIWIKIDAGYGRTGILWSDSSALTAVAQAVQQAPNLTLSGLLTHAGHSYHGPDPVAIEQIYQQTVRRMNAARAVLRELGIETAVSVGDTPGCSVAADLGNVDEIRPGNYVFYDLMQQQIGACRDEDIAVGVACPVVAKHAAGRRIILYGGAVHLSKDVMQVNGRPCYGRVALLHKKGWGQPFAESMLTSLSQEHGIVTAEAGLFEAVNVGDLLLVLPVHSCLTVDLYPEYLTFSGQRIPKMRTN